jgi:prepilin peptidase CpaA
MSRAFLSDLVLVMTAAVLFYVAFTDLKDFKIRNELVATLAGLFVIHAVLSGLWTGILWNFAFALAMFAVMLVFYARNWMGGGDVKLLGVAFLWVGLRCALPFAVLLLAFASIHALIARFGLATAPPADGDKHRRIAFAPSVAAALIGTFMLGCLAPV